MCLDTVCLETIPIFDNGIKSVNFSVNFIAFFQYKTLIIFTLLKCANHEGICCS